LFCIRSVLIPVFAFSTRGDAPGMRITHFTTPRHGGQGNFKTGVTCPPQRASECNRRSLFLEVDLAFSSPDKYTMDFKKKYHFYRYRLLCPASSIHLPLSVILPPLIWWEMITEAFGRPRNRVSPTHEIRIILMNDLLLSITNPGIMP
jgi:hypothetical protein